MGLLEGCQERGTEDGAQGLDREEDAGLGGHPARPVLGSRTRGYQTVAMEGGIARLVPGVQDQRGAELAVPILRATLAERLADGAAQESQEEAFVAHEERIEVVRHGKHGVAVGRGEPLSLPRCHPLGRGPRLTFGTVAIPARAIGIALNAALRTPLCMPPKLGRATGHEGVDALLLGRGAPIALPGGVAREAEDVGDFPPRSVGAWRAVPGMGTAHHGRPCRTPSQPWAGRPDPPADRMGGGPWPRAAG